MAGNHTHRSVTRASHSIVRPEDVRAYPRQVRQHRDFNSCCGPSSHVYAGQGDAMARRYRASTIETEHAAKIIQSNFKHYTLSKNFEKLKSSHDQSRVQRLRMSDISSDRDSVWSDVAVISQPGSPHKPMMFHGEDMFDGNEDQDSGDFTSPSPSPDSFQVADADDDSLSYVRSHSTSDSRLQDIQLKFHNGTDRSRKRQYRIGLNLFNKKPEKGIRYLMEQRFLRNSSKAVAEFLISRKGLSKQMIGEYLGNIRTPFNQDVLISVVQHLNFTGLEVDQALRKLIHLFRLPGESQKIQCVMERFAQRYCFCNPSYVRVFDSVDAIFLLSYAIIMVNTDLHNPNIKAVNKMSKDAFIKNFKTIDNGKEVPTDLLAGIYNRILKNELRVGPDHVSQVRKVEKTMVGNIPVLAIPERRLVCYCRLYELSDPNKKEKHHQREIFLFNDILVITKIYAKKKDRITYTYRRSIRIADVIVQCFESEHYKFGIKLISGVNKATLIHFNARNKHDRDKFVDDLVDSIAELKEMSLLPSTSREAEKNLSTAQSRMSKDSGVGDLDSRKSAELPRAHPPHAAEHEDRSAQARSSSLTEIGNGLLKSQHSHRSDSHCVVVTRKSYHV